MFDIHLNSEHCTYLSNIAAIGVVTNSVLNPVIYSFLSTNFRQKVSRRTRNFIRMRKCNFSVITRIRTVVRRTYQAKFQPPF